MGGGGFGWTSRCSCLPRAFGLSPGDANVGRGSILSFGAAATDNDGLARYKSPCSRGACSGAKQSAEWPPPPLPSPVIRPSSRAYNIAARTVEGTPGRVARYLCEFRWEKARRRVRRGRDKIISDLPRRSGSPRVRQCHFGNGKFNPRGAGGWRSEGNDSIAGTLTDGGASSFSFLPLPNDPLSGRSFNRNANR